MRPYAYKSRKKKYILKKYSNSYEKYSKGKKQRKKKNFMK